MKQIQKKIGPNFGTELLAASQEALPVSWSSEGVEYDEERLSAKQIRILQDVVKKHDHNKPDSMQERLEILGEDASVQELFRNLETMTSEEFDKFATSTDTKNLLASILKLLAIRL